MDRIRPIGEQPTARGERGGKPPDSAVEDLRPLTSLRFVAAMMIVFLHCKLYFSWTWLNAPAMRDIPLVHGVSFFFVLSGFILTHVYSAKRTGYRQFMWNRIARLWPLHACCILLLLAIMPFYRVTFEGSGFFSKWATLAANLTLIHSAVPFTSYILSWNGVSWSISTEMFFYLAFPLLLIDLERRWLRNLLVAAAAIAAFGLLAHILKVPADAGLDDLSLTSLCYANPLFRAFEFCLGMATYVLWRRRPDWLDRPSVATLAEAAAAGFAALWLSVGFWMVYPYASGLAVLRQWYGEAGSAWMFAILIFVIARGRGLIGRAFAIPVCVWLGEISFAVYMLHAMLMKAFFLHPAWQREYLVFPAILGAAAIAHHAVELPSRAALLRKPITAPRAASQNAAAAV